MSKSLLFLALTSLTLGPVLRAESTLPDDAKASIDAAVNQVLSSTKVPSASIAVVDRRLICRLDREEIDIAPAISDFFKNQARLGPRDAFSVNLWQRQFI